MCSSKPKKDVCSYHLRIYLGSESKKMSKNIEAQENLKHSYKISYIPAWHFSVK